MRSILRSPRGTAIALTMVSLLAGLAPAASAEVADAAADPWGPDATFGVREDIRLPQDPAAFQAPAAPAPGAFSWAPDTTFGVREDITLPMDAHDFQVPPVGSYWSPPPAFSTREDLTLPGGVAAPRFDPAEYQVDPPGAAFDAADGTPPRVNAPLRGAGPDDLAFASPQSEVRSEPSAQPVVPQPLLGVDPSEPAPPVATIPDPDSRSLRLRPAPEGGLPPAGDAGDAGDAEEAQDDENPTQSNPLRAPIYALTGAGFSYLLQRDIQPDAGQIPETVMMGRLAPNLTGGFFKDLMFAGALPQVQTGNPWTDALANGCQAAAATQCLFVGSRRVLNPVADHVLAERRVKAGADALIDPRRVTLSPNPSVNIPPGRTPGTSGLDPSAFDPPAWEAGLSGSRPRLDVRPVPVDAGNFGDPSVQFQPGLGLPRLGAPPGTKAGTEYSIADSIHFTPEQHQTVQRWTDGTVLGINLAGPLLSTATNETLKALGQEDNYALNVGAQAVLGAGLPVGAGISYAQGKLVPGAFVYPTIQSAVARVGSDVLVGLAPASVQQALGEACSDDNPVFNAAATLACDLGQNPDQTPPTGPPPSTGAAPALAAVSGEPPSSGVALGVDAPVAELLGGGSGEAGSSERVAALRAKIVEWRGLLRAGGVDAPQDAQVVNWAAQKGWLQAAFAMTGDRAAQLLGVEPTGSVGSRLVGSVPVQREQLRVFVGRWRGLLAAEGIDAPQDGQVVNQAAARGWLQQAFGMTGQRAVQVLGVAPTSSMGTARVGPGRVGPGRVGPGRVGPGRVGPARVGPGSAPAAAAAGPVGGSRPAVSPGSRVQAPVRVPAPASRARLSVPARPAQQQVEPSWQQRVGDAVNQAGRVIAPAARGAGQFLRGAWGVGRILWGN